jgi:hypothetical protein
MAIAANIAMPTQAMTRPAFFGAGRAETRCRGACDDEAFSGAQQSAGGEKNAHGNPWHAFKGERQKAKRS